jgi:hypothetical protein
MGLRADRPLVSDMRSSIINKEEHFFQLHISLTIVSFQTRMKVMRSSWFVVYLLISWKLLKLDWYVMREEPNNTINTMMNTSKPTMNNVTYY